jgi:hypothetical protein
MLIVKSCSCVPPRSGWSSNSPWNATIGCSARDQLLLKLQPVFFGHNLGAWVSVGANRGHGGEISRAC